MAVRGPRDRGQVLPVLVFAVVFVGAVAFGALRLAAELTSRAHAGTVADAVALAGALGGESAAAAVAAANGAVLERFERSGDVAAVWVRVGRSRASARAERLVEESEACPDPRPGSAEHPVHCERVR